MNKAMDPVDGANQSRMRDYNERLVLSLVRRHLALPKSEIAKTTGLSAQTISVIMRALESDGLLLRGEPQRGKVGQPSIPMSLNPDGVFSIGINVGRRKCDIVLIDFLGQERLFLQKHYGYPQVKEVLDFAIQSVREIMDLLGEANLARIAGIGISMPFSIWSWTDFTDAPAEKMDEWRDFDLSVEMAQVFSLPTFLQNDATSACSAELLFGKGEKRGDFVHFFVNTFIGGGIVLNNTVYSGRSGNAGALGSMPVKVGSNSKDNHDGQLINHASLHVLKGQLVKAGIEPSRIWETPDNWPDYGEILESWLRECAKHLAYAAVASCSVIDFGAVVLDGAFPADIRERLLDLMNDEMDRLDLRGIDRPILVAGTMGAKAGVMGAASLPLFDRYLLGQNLSFA